MFIGSYPIQIGGSAIYQPVGGGRLKAGVYPCNSSGDRTYFSTGTNEYSGITFDSTYDIYYFEVDADGNKYAPQLLTGSPFTLSLGQNTAIPIVSAYGNPTVNVVMYLTDAITIDPTRDGDFTFLQSDIGNTSKISGTISGGALSETLPSPLTAERIDTTYVGAFTPPEGDYEHVYTQIDPNGVETSSTAITIRWAPHTFLKTIDGNANMRDAQPDVSGVESINIEYVKGYNVLTDGNTPQYDVNGELQTLDGGQDILVSYGIDPSLNEIQITGVTDDFGNAKDTDTKQITRIPALRYDGLTTVDEETYGTSYDGALSLIVDEGLSNEITVTPEEAPYTFTSGDYKDYNFTASYTYPTGESNSVPVVITYQQSAGYESDFINQWLFDNPYVGSDSATYTTEDDAGTIRYTTVSDIIANDGDFQQTTTAIKPTQGMSAFQRKGLQQEINVYQAMSKVYTGNEGWFNSEHAIVLNMVGPNLFGSSFEYTIMMAGFNDRPLQVRPSGAGYNVGNKATWDSSVLSKGQPQTVICGRDSSGNYRLVSSEGADLTVSGFSGWSAVNMFLGYFVTDTIRQCDAIIHEIGTLSFFPDASYRSDIYTRSVSRWFEIPTTGGNTITQNGLTKVTSDGLTQETPLA